MMTKNDSMLAIAVGKPVFMADAEEVLKILLNIQGNLMPGYDPQASFLKTAWARLCKVLKEDFVPYLGFVLPELFEIIKQDVNIIVLDGLFTITQHKRKRKLIKNKNKKNS